MVGVLHSFHEILLPVRTCSRVDDSTSWDSPSPNSSGGNTVVPLKCKNEFLRFVDNIVSSTRQSDDPTLYSIPVVRSTGAMFNSLYAIVHMFIFRGNDDNDAHVHGFETFISLKRYIVFIIFYLKYVDGAFNALSGNLKQNTHTIY